MTGMPFCDSFGVSPIMIHLYKFSLSFLLKKIQYHFSHGIRTDPCPGAEAGFLTPEDTSSTPPVPRDLLPNPPFPGSH